MKASFRGVGFLADADVDYVGGDEVTVEELLVELGLIFVVIKYLRPRSWGLGVLMSSPDEQSTC